MAMKLIAAVLVSVWSTSPPPEGVSGPVIEKSRSQSAAQLAIAQLIEMKVIDVQSGSSASPAPATSSSGDTKGLVLSHKRARAVNGPARSAPRERGCSQSVL